MKKTFQCNGTVVSDMEAGAIIQLSGDNRTSVKQFLSEKQVCHVDQIVLHGG